MSDRSLISNIIIFICFAYIVITNLINISLTNEFSERTTIFLTEQKINHKELICQRNFLNIVMYCEVVIFDKPSKVIKCDSKICKFINEE